MTRRRAVARLLLEWLPAYLIALLLLPWIISGGHPVPWQPALIDLDVYRAAATDLLAGRDFYLTRTPFWELPFIYPPIAAILAIPLVLLPLLPVQLAWTALGVAAQHLVLIRAGVRRGLALMLMNIVAVVAVEPIRTTLGYGQVNTMLMALVVADLLPVRDRTFLPRGTLLGLAAAIKLTPLLFIVFLCCVGRWRTAVVATASAGVVSLIGLVVFPQATVTYVGKVISGDTYGNPVYAGNQSVVAVFERLTGTGWGWDVAGLAAGIFAAGLVLFGAIAVWRHGERVLATGLVGLATCLASPLSWTHHFVWVLPVGIGAVAAARRHAAGGGGSPPLVTGPCLAWSAWVASGPVLAFLPYGEGIERSYSLAQQILANLTPVLGVLIGVGALVWWRQTARGDKTGTVTGLSGPPALGSADA